MVMYRVISLGEIVMQDQMQALQAFAKLINPSEPHTALPKLGALLQDPATQELLDQFKLGAITEESFVTTMIAKITDITTVTLTRDAFYTAWNSMNPKFPAFSDTLSSVLTANNEELKIVFLSYTNSIDMRHLMEELSAHSIPFTCDATTGVINSIGNIPLYLTYTEKQSKAELIQRIFQSFRDPASDGAVFTSTFFGKPATLPSVSLDIKYIRGVKGPTDPALRQLMQISRDAIAAATEASCVETILWDKIQPFSDIVQTASIPIPAARL